MRRPPAPRHRTGLVGGLVVVALLSVACGTRRDMSDLEAAARGEFGHTVTSQPSDPAPSGEAAPPALVPDSSALAQGGMAASAGNAGGAADAGPGAAHGAVPTDRRATSEPAPAHPAPGSGNATAAPAPARPAGAAGQSQPAVAAAVGGGGCGSRCSPVVIGSVGTYSGLIGQNIGR
ncbi:MAG: hypothetical protein LC792_05655 [Actinobacteria bacterium]|nr:hypothetical protein [Actinomycetota bacterium]